MRTQLVESKYPKPEQRQIFFDALQARLRALPGVTSAAIASSFPLSGAGQCERSSSKARRSIRMPRRDRSLSSM